MADWLRESIIDGSFPAGMQLVEMRLAEQLGVSRGPVRSALQTLEGEGLVVTQRNGRSTSAGFARGDVHDLFQTRYEMESTALRWAFARDANPAPLLAALDALTAEGASTPHLVELDICFHQALVELSGSRFLAQAWLALAPVIQAVITVGNRRLATDDPKSNFERIEQSHRVLCDAIVDQDLESACTMLSAQFELTQAMVLRPTAE